ncbi:hypothetical protein [Ralstonia mannitolilytica]|uniref:hypothetical protein n=1 Tax=Ralstonia mannitolilytica TaxID=105219 RepID=UPI000CEE5D70|nr:hypothetical protein [Ralstonia mannitolilytica]
MRGTTYIHHSAPQGFQADFNVEPFASLLQPGVVFRVRNLERIDCDFAEVFLTDDAALELAAALIEATSIQDRERRCVDLRRNRISTISIKEVGVTR